MTNLKLCYYKSFPHIDRLDTRYNFKGLIGLGAICFAKQYLFMNIISKIDFCVLCNDVCMNVYIVYVMTSCQIQSSKETPTTACGFAPHHHFYNIRSLSFVIATKIRTKLITINNFINYDVKNI